MPLDPYAWEKTRVPKTVASDCSFQIPEKSSKVTYGQKPLVNCSKRHLDDNHLDVTSCPKKRKIKRKSSQVQKADRKESETPSSKAEEWEKYINCDAFEQPTSKIKEWEKSIDWDTLSHF